MEKVRVYNIAQRLNIKSSVVVDALKRRGIKVANHFSTVKKEVADKFVDGWMSKKTKKIKPKIIRPKVATKKVDEGDIIIRSKDEAVYRIPLPASF